MKQYFVYMLASGKKGTLYTGFTANLISRISQHKHEQADGFTKKYKIKTLVHYEVFDSYESALRREKCIKEWKRAWKIELIEKHNPQWRELYGDICC